MQPTMSRPTARHGPDQVLWLVRHGESSWNTLGLVQGHNDQARLTARGIRQAWRVAGQLRDRPIRALYVSDLHRASQTAAPLAAVLGRPVQRDARLRERCLGVLEGTATAATPAALTGLAADRVADPDARPPGGESLRDFYQRVAGFAVDLTAADPAAGEIAVVAHGGTLRMLTAYLGGIDVERMRWAPVANGCVLRWPSQFQQVTTAER